MKKMLLLWFLSCLTFSCQQEETANTTETQPTKEHTGPKTTKATQKGKAFVLHSGSDTGLDFNNEVIDSPDFNFLEWEEIYNGGGVAVGDINNDGLPDVFFAGNQVEDQLYLNKGDLKFENISQQAGIAEKDRWSTGVSFFDFNADGWLDIYVCRTHWSMDAEGVDERRNRLWLNNGDLTFTEKAAEYGLDDPGHSTQLAPLDFDLDGDLDLFLANTLSSNSKQKRAYMSQQGGPDLSDKLFRNDGGKFVDITKEAGLTFWGFTLGVNTSDLNNDGYPDIYLANDYEGPDCFYINQKNGQFKNEVSRKLKHMSFFSMGCDAGDINNDGLMDLAVLDMQASDHYRAKTNMRSMSNERFWELVDRGYQFQYMSNALHLNHDVGFFSEIGEFAGVSQTDWSWSALLEDFDADGWQDLIVTNGILKDIRNTDFTNEIGNQKKQGASRMDLYKLSKKIPQEKLNNYFFRNSTELSFEDVSDEYGFNFKGFSHGAAMADFDNDGDPDLLVSNSGDLAQLYENVNSSYLKIDFDFGEKNKFGIGTKVWVTTNGNTQFKELQTTRGYKSASQAALFFGLNGAQKADKVRMEFVGGQTWEATNVDASKTLTITSKDKREATTRKKTNKAWFVDHTRNSNITFQHQEDEFDDFEREILLPHKLSKDGPALATGDINRDGKMDFYVGGAAGQAGGLFLQVEKGQFSRIAQQPWEKDAHQEDIDALFFDANSDGGLDLLVLSGGSKKAKGDGFYEDRLYLNSPQGYVKSSDFPKLNFDASCVAAADFDKDGDMDLFIGSKSIPGQYPKSDRSVLLLNTAGKFVVANDKYCSDLNTAGMVRDAIWSDVNGDSYEDLMLVGEWMSPKVFINKAGKSLELQEENADLVGWWFHIRPADLDGDGDTDYLLGNIGMNNKYRASKKKPLKVYASDFDKNKSNDIVLAKNYDGAEVPVRGRECTSEQMPFVAEKFQNYDLFAKAELEDIYGQDQLQSSVHYEAREFRTGVWWNDGGQLTFEPLPALAQLSAVTGSAVRDFDGDGQQDIVLVGNHYDAEVETVRHDAGNGWVFRGRGARSFEALSAKEGGFYAPFNAKDLQILEPYNGSDFLLLVANNDFFVQAMRANK